MAHQKCYHTCSAVNDVLMLRRAILLIATTFDIVVIAHLKFHCLHLIYW
jgi:hypothetical protein